MKKRKNLSSVAERRTVPKDEAKRRLTGMESRALAERISAMTPKDVKQTDSTQIIRDDHDLRHIIKEIGTKSEGIVDTKIPAKPAVYGIFAVTPDCLSAIQLGRTDLLYIGKSTDLADRGHFKKGKTSSSTLRRTLGALLKRELRLRAYARGRGLTSNDFTHYRFDESDEQKLTEWMRTNLRIGFSIVIDDIDEIEKRLVRYCEPVLNLTFWNNPQAESIKALRKICAGEARTNGPLLKR